MIKAAVFYNCVGYEKVEEILFSDLFSNRYEHQISIYVGRKKWAIMVKSLEKENLLVGKTSIWANDISKFL